MSQHFTDAHVVGFHLRRRGWNKLSLTQMQAGFKCAGDFMRRPAQDGRYGAPATIPKPGRRHGAECWAEWMYRGTLAPDTPCIQNSEVLHPLCHVRARSLLTHRRLDTSSPDGIAVDRVVRTDPVVSLTVFLTGQASCRAGRLVVCTRAAR
jgi:hypothetical protein